MHAVHIYSIKCSVQSIFWDLQDCSTPAFHDYHGTFLLGLCKLKNLARGIEEQCSFSWNCKKEFIHVNKRNRFNIEVAVYSFNFETILNLLLKVAKCTCRDSLQDIYQNNIFYFSVCSFSSFSQIMLCAKFNYELEHKSQKH